MKELSLFAVGAISDLPLSKRLALLSRTSARDPDIQIRTAAIIGRVRQERDAALFELAKELDRVALAKLEVDPSLGRKALEGLDRPLRTALERAKENLTRVHRAQCPSASELEVEPGVWVGRRPDPLSRVGVYAPGGRAAYPSSVLMGAVPAKVAGVKEVILCSPPGADGHPSSVVLAAAFLAGVDRIFALGGAGAIAAMALGTQSVPRVNRIVGPGNAYVAEAKLLLAGEVGIDSPAGPSEILVIADADADPDAVARELLAQAEHDPRACVVAVALDASLAGKIVNALRRVPECARQEVIAEALVRGGAVLTAASLDEAVAFSNDFAPEHLLVAIKNPDAALERLKNAGTIFLNQWTSVAFGDYLTGSNHVLPTGGLARSYSGLSTLDFIRWTSWQRVTRDGAARLADDVVRLAESEGLFAHAAAAAAWRWP